MKLSIVIVSWNARDYLDQCLRSIQTTALDVAPEVIVVDNASTDGSPGLVEQRFPEVKLVRSPENLGFAKGNNLGLKLATGDYLCLINSDVVLLEGCLQKLLGFMDANPRVGMAGPRILNADRTFQAVAGRMPTLITELAEALFLDRILLVNTLFPGALLKERDLVRTRPVDILYGCFWVVRRQALQVVGGLDETYFMYSEDVDWCRRFNRAGWQVVYFPECQAIHYGGASSTREPSRFYVELKKARLLYWQKHHGVLVRRLGAGVIFVHCLLRLLGWGIVYLTIANRLAVSRRMQAQYLATLRWLLSRRPELVPPAHR